MRKIEKDIGIDYQEVQRLQQKGKHKLSIQNTVMLGQLDQTTPTENESQNQFNPIPPLYPTLNQFSWS